MEQQVVHFRHMRVEGWRETRRQIVASAGRSRCFRTWNDLVAPRDRFSSVPSAQGPVNRGVDVFRQGPDGTIHHRDVQAITVKTAEAEEVDTAADVVIAYFRPTDVKICRGIFVIASTCATGVVVTPVPEQRFSEQQRLCGPVCDISNIDPAVLVEDPIVLRIV